MNREKKIKKGETEKRKQHIKGKIVKNKINQLNYRREKIMKEK
jgi:hypothetical protein